MQSSEFPPGENDAIATHVHSNARLMPGADLIRKFSHFYVAYLLFCPFELIIGQCTAPVKLYLRLNEIDSIIQ